MGRARHGGHRDRPRGGPGLPGAERVQLGRYFAGGRRRAVVVDRARRRFCGRELFLPHLLRLDCAALHPTAASVAASSACVVHQSFDRPQCRLCRPQQRRRALSLLRTLGSILRGRRQAGHLLRHHRRDGSRHRRRLHIAAETFPAIVIRRIGSLDGARRRPVVAYPTNGVCRLDAHQPVRLPLSLDGSPAVDSTGRGSSRYRQRQLPLRRGQPASTAGQRRIS